jgi:hypothetical protein
MPPKRKITSVLSTRTQPSRKCQKTQPNVDQGSSSDEDDTPNYEGGDSISEGEKGEGERGKRRKMKKKKSEVAAQSDTEDNDEFWTREEYVFLL